MFDSFRHAPRLRGLAVALALGAAALVPSAAADLVVAVARSPLSLPLHVAQAQGFFGAEGVAVQELECSGGAACMQELLAGRAQLATASELPVVFASFGRSDHAIVGTFVSSSDNIKLVARKSAGVSAPAQLAGKRVGLIAGTSSHYYLDAFLLFHGIEPRQVQVVPLAGERLAGAIERREIDALVSYSQHTAPALKALGADAAVLGNPRIYTERFNLVANRGVLAGREDEVVRMLRAIERAERFIAEQPAQAKAILRARLKQDEAFADAVFPLMQYRLALEQSLISTMEGEGRWALREGHAAAGAKLPNYLQFVDAGPLRKAVPAAFPK